LVQQQRLRPLVEGALLAAITAVFGMLSLNVPLTSFFTDFLWGIPIIIAFIRHDWRIALMALTVAGILTLILTDPVRAGLYFVQLAPVAVVYGLMFKKRLSAGKILLTGTVVTVIAEALVLGLYLYTQRNVFHFEEEINRQAREAIEFYRKTGLLEYYSKQGLNEAAIKELIDRSVGLAKLLIPGTFIITAMVKAVLTFLISVRVLERLGFGGFRLPAFREWRLPWQSSWVFMTGLLLALAGDHYGMPVLATIGKNIVFICFPIFFIIGLAVGVHFYRRWTLPGWVKILIIIITVVNFSGSLLFFTGLGIFDPLVNFRVLGQARNQ